MSLLVTSFSPPAAASPPRDGRDAREGGSRFANSDGRRVHYRSYGKGSEALVFVHGWTCDLSFWRMQVPAFAGRTRVIALDLPGHGRSDAPPEPSAYTMDSFARAVDAVLRDAGVRRAVLVGHSMGTPVVRQFYRHFPRKTLALVFVDGALWPVAPREATAQFLAPLRADYRAAATPMIEGMLKPMRSDTTRGEVRAAMLATPPHVAVAAMEGMLDETLWKDDPVNVPALAVLARSPFWPADAERRFKRLAPVLDYEMWEGVSHFLMMDEPDKFNAALAAFLARHKLLRQK